MTHPCLLSHKPIQKSNNLGTSAVVIGAECVDARACCDTLGQSPVYCGCVVCVGCYISKRVGGSEIGRTCVADFMTRNTLKRVEVAAPIYDEAVRNKIRHIFDVALSDNVKGKRTTPDGTYSEIITQGEKINSQEVFYQEAYDAEINS